MTSGPSSRLRESFEFHLRHLEVCIDLVRKDPSSRAVELLRGFALRMKQIGKRARYESLEKAADEMDYASDETVIAGSQTMRSLLRQYGISAEDDRPAFLIVSPDLELVRSSQAAINSLPSSLLHASSADEAEALLDREQLAVIVADASAAGFDIEKFLGSCEARTGGNVGVIGIHDDGNSEIERRLWENGATACLPRSGHGANLSGILVQRMKRAVAEREQVRRDWVTGLPNRAALLEEFQRAHSLAVQDQSPLSFAMLDVDRFSLCRKTHGFRNANDALREFCRVIRANIRDYDYLARWREDRFVALFPGAKPGEALASLGRCQESLRHEELPTSDGSRLKLTFSAGLAKVPSVDAITAAFSLAYTHLEVAKSAGAGVLSSDENRLDAEASGSANVSGAGKPRPRILVIDDDVSTLAMMKKILTHAGYEVEIAETGQEGILRNKRTHPDLILCDVNMPGMNGFTVCARIRGRKVERGEAEGRDVDPSATVPILMLTADSSQDSVKIALSRGANGYLLKPVKPKELKERIDKVLTEREALKSIGS